MRKNIVSVVVLVVSCGPQQYQVGDDGTTVDAIGDGSGSGSDHTPVVDTLTCQTHTITVVNANGTKTVTDSGFALVPNIDPTSAFVVETCDYIQSVTTGGVTTTAYVFVPKDQACPSGASCTASGAAFPTPAHECNYNNAGMFFDGQLYVTCTTHTTNYDANGNVTSTLDYGPRTIRLHH